MKGILRSTIKQLSTITSGLPNQKKLLILIYHRVLDRPDYMRPGEVDKVVFSWHAEVLSRYFNVLSLRDALEKIQDGSLPSRSICITFDDGYADNYINALPILNKFGLEATFFIASGFLDGGMMWNDCVIEGLKHSKKKQLDLSKINLSEFDISTNKNKAHAAATILKTIKHLKPGLRQELADYFLELSTIKCSETMLTTGQLRQLYQSGMEIGGHTISHPILATLENNKANSEIKENKRTLEKILSTKIAYFAYPNGKPELDYLQDHVEMVKANGYKAALSTNWGVMHKNSDKWQLPRFTPWDTNPEKFMLRIANIYRT